MKKGFTLLELMIVVTILAVLLGIVTTAATASIRKARDRRTQAMKLTLQSGIAAYKASRKVWPGEIEKWASQADHNGKLGYLSTTPEGQYDKVVQELLRVSAGKGATSRVLDPTGLLVMRASDPDGLSGGRDYRAVATKNSKYGKRMSSREMTVVYQNANSGKSYRFVIEYNTESDEVTVMTHGDFSDKTGRSWTGGEVWR